MHGRISTDTSLRAVQIQKIVRGHKMHAPEDAPRHDETRKVPSTVGREYEISGIGRVWPGQMMQFVGRDTSRSAADMANERAQI